MSKVIICQGLPASGKSTFVKDLCLTQENWVRINRDDLRQMLHAGKWSFDNEKVIVAARNALIRMALDRGQNIVIDDTNFGRNIDQIEHQLNEWRKELPTSRSLPNIEIRQFPEKLSTCIIRNSLRHGVGRIPDDAINRMFEQFVKGTELEVPE